MRESGPTERPIREIKEKYIGTQPIKMATARTNKGPKEWHDTRQHTDDTDEDRAQDKPIGKRQERTLVVENHLFVCKPGIDAIHRQAPLPRYGLHIMGARVGIVDDCRRGRAALLESLRRRRADAALLNNLTRNHRRDALFDRLELEMVKPKDALVSKAHGGRFYSSTRKGVKGRFRRLGGVGLFLFFAFLNRFRVDRSRNMLMHCLLDSPVEQPVLDVRLDGVEKSLPEDLIRTEHVDENGNLCQKNCPVWSTESAHDN